jgi:hypothetical protein
MEKPLFIALYIAGMAAPVIVLDVLFLRNRFRERLMVNIGIVAAFLIFYLIFLKRP